MQQDIGGLETNIKVEHGKYFDKLIPSKEVTTCNNAQQHVTSQMNICNKVCVGWNEYKMGTCKLISQTFKDVTTGNNA